MADPSEGPPAGTDQGAQKIVRPPQTSTEAECSGPGAEDVSAEPVEAESETGLAAESALDQRVAEHLRRREQRRLARQEFAELRRHGVAQRHANKLRRMPGGGGRR